MDGLDLEHPAKEPDVVKIEEIDETSEPEEADWRDRTIRSDDMQPMPFEEVRRRAEERSGSYCPPLPEGRRPAWVMCFGTDEVDDVRGLTRRWAQLYTHEGPKVVDYVFTSPIQTDLEMWNKAANLLGFTLVPGIPKVTSREDARLA